MTIAIRLMRDGEAEAVAEMVRALARDIGVPVAPRLTGDALLDALDLLEVLVADEGGELLGACLSLATYSTWRAARGLYVVDLFVDHRARNRRVGLALLREAAIRARRRGARFVKLEVDHANSRAERFYQRLGFQRHEEDHLLVLEEAALTTLALG